MTRRDAVLGRGRVKVATAAMAMAAMAAMAGCADPPDGPGAETTAPETSAPGTTVAETTVPDTTVEATTTTVPETTTTAPPPPAPLGSLVLADDGIGPWRFGDEPEEVIAGVAAVLGTPSADTGWVGAEELLCPGQERRRVEWGVFRLDFGDSAQSGPSDERVFLAWDYGLESMLGEEPRGLITARGVGLGARVDELVDAYPDVVLSPGEEGVFSASFVIDANLSGLITGVADDDTVTVMSGGEICGE